VGRARLYVGGGKSAHVPINTREACAPSLVVRRRARLSGGMPKSAAADAGMVLAVASFDGEVAMSEQDVGHNVCPIRIGDAVVGPGQRAYVIAEVGVNHNGDVETAKRMVDVARQAGADAVKLQAFRAERLVTRSASMADYQKGRAPGASSQYEMLRELELWPDAFAEIRTHCRQCGVAFLATPFAPEDVAMLASLDPVAIKIASSDLTNTPLLETAADTHLPLIVSTGAAKGDEIDAGIAWLRQRDAADRLVLLHCVSSYPTDPCDANLRRIAVLADRFGVPTGFSDHTAGIEAGALAVAAGAVMIEKHFTLNRNQVGPDHSFSLEPDALAAYIRNIRLAEQMLGSGNLDCTDCEQQVRNLSRASVVAAVDIAAGQVLRPHMLAVKRPAGGIEPLHLHELIGLTAAQDIPADTALMWEMIGSPAPVGV